ncbi:L-lactate dehydrogenase [Lactobacillus sp. 0.1XD8-4]|uniref:L-lactate dehydrogenase n=1 Tax=uncultured Limosilactobacillus sp. TaxID=2837629 RepID=UPI00129D9C18|nr:L-lactate dehydrogenase [uncultured Limosilactobacillus sp.]MRN07686.1 L-lactate dehydrogenase [Lactobacillus sp. 0.1XD8-4]
MYDDHQKVVLIGDGAVGSAYAYAAINQGMTGELAIINHTKEKAIGDVMDLEDATPYRSSLKIYAADYETCYNADIVVICAGAPQKPGETRLQLVTKNLKIVKEITKKVVSSGFDGIFIVAANPVDIMSYAVLKQSGFASEQVIGTGTSLDTARLKIALAKMFNVNAQSININVLAEHGDSEFAAFSSADIGGIPLLNLISQEGYTLKDLANVEKSVRNKAYQIIDYKGATFYGVATAIMRIATAILRDEGSVITVGCYLDGQYGYDDVYIGTPAVVGAGGIQEIIELPLNIVEKQAMASSVETLKKTTRDSMIKAGMINYLL